jgi:hypothetical protein
VTWTAGEVEAGHWLELSGRDPAEVERAVAAFNWCEQLAGRAWFERKSVGFGIDGWKVVALRHVAAQVTGAVAPNLLRKMLGTNVEAVDWALVAELRVLECLRLRGLPARYEPTIDVGGHDRKPDFVVSLAEEDCYVEVTCPERGSIYEAVYRQVLGLTSRLATPGRYVECRLARLPRDADLVRLRILAQHDSRRTYVARVAGLADVYVEPYSDRHGHGLPPYSGNPLMEMDALWSVNGALACVSVAYPFSDSRAKKIVKDEASQLPPGKCGLLIIDVT